MSPTHPQRRARSIWAAAVADPLRKLLAIVLAIGLWILLDDSVTGEERLTLQLVVPGPEERLPERATASQLLVGLPPDLVALRAFKDTAGNRITSVDLEVKGPQWVIDGLRGRPLVLTVAWPTGVDWQTKDSVDFSVAEIQRTDRLLQNVDMNLEPPRVTVEIERMDAMDIPLALERTALQADARLQPRLRMDTAEFSRESVRVRGTARHLQRLRSIEKPFVANLTARANERQLTAALQLAVPADVPLAIADPCSLTIQLMPVTEQFAFDLPLRIDDLSLPAALRGRYRVEPKTRSVRILAGGALRSTLIAFEESERQQWASDHLRLLAWIQPREDSAAFGPDIVVEARLEVQGPLRDRLDLVEFGLAEPVSVTLHRDP
jgi:hypothetical protein